MSTRIKLVRMGAKRRPAYRLVVVDSRKTGKGAVIDSLGAYSPLGAGENTFQKEKVEEWVKKGAQLTKSAADLISGKKRKKRKKKSKAEKKAEKAKAEEAKKQASEKSAPSKDAGKEKPADKSAEEKPAPSKAEGKE